MITSDTIAGLVREHESWRGRCLNLIASENALSPDVRRYLASDLVQRYGNYAGRDLRNRRYTGNRYVTELELALENIVREVFGATEVELRAISGHVAGLAIIMATCRPGDTIVELASADGGHCLAEKAIKSPLIDLQVLSLPFDANQFNVDVEATCALIAQRRPRLVIVGASNFLFPVPLGEIAAAARASGTVLAYDASHVLGLLACGEFQDPLAEGADVVFGSTHKTLPGPQGGLIIANDPGLMEAIATAVYPGVVTNHHLMRGPALALALLEARTHPEYGRCVIANAQALGRRLAERGHNVIAAQQGITQSHTVLVGVSGMSTGREAAEALEAADIMVSYTRLPEALGTEGIRLGTAEVTRHGAGEAAMAAAADLVADVLQGRLEAAAARAAVHAWSASLPGLRFIDQ